MTISTMRPLALLTACCLWSGCAEKEPAKAGDPTPKSEERASAEPTIARKAQPLPELATTAQRTLTTILDQKSADIPQEVGELAKVDQLKAAELAPAAADGSLAVPSTDDASQDFDREVEVSEIKIDRFVLAEGVQGREPWGEADVFHSDAKEIFAFVEFSNPAGAPYAVRVHWEPVEGPASPYGFKFEVPTAPRWRTWSWTRIKRAPGRYRAVLRTLNGDEVASREFLIQEVDEH